MSGEVVDGGARAAVLAQVATLLDGRDLGRPVRVGVDGITSAGKSTFADELAVALRERGRPVVRVSMDGFHHRRAHRHRQGRMSADGYYEDAYDIAAAARELLAPLGPEGDRRYRSRVIDLASDEPITDDASLAPVDAVLVLDGSFLQRLADDLDEVAWLDVPFDVAQARGVDRDADALDGREAAAAAFRQRYHAACRRYLAEFEPEARADIVVDNTDLARPVLCRPVASTP